ncbi:MAG: hypothetical protein LBR51_06000 [Bacteroidales bacterium]|nr:hypothetical protein [Bacteroidales bacterium]
MSPIVIIFVCVFAFIVFDILYFIFLYPRIENMSIKTKLLLALSILVFFFLVYLGIIILIEGSVTLALTKIKNIKVPNLAYIISISIIVLVPLAFAIVNYRKKKKDKKNNR